MAKYDLEDRLLEYAAAVIRLSEILPQTRAANHIAGQLIRSGTLALFNHGEAQAAESPNDFIHKLRICLKELRESRRALRLIVIIPLISDQPIAQGLIMETEELIRIFVTSIRTAEKNKVRETSDVDYPVSEIPNFDVGR